MRLALDVVQRAGAVRAANSVIAEYGFVIEQIEWQTTPLRVHVYKVARGFARLRQTRPTRSCIVEEPYPAFFPSEVFLQRVLLLA